MIISVNTETMSRMSYLAQQADIEIESTAALLLSVTEHNEWNCIERDMINDLLIGIRNKAKIVQENIQIFSGSISKVAKQFEDEENSIAGRYQHLDTLLARSLTSSVSGTKVVAELPKQSTTRIANALSSEFIPSSNLESYALGNVTEEIKIVPLETIWNGELTLVSNEDFLQTVGPEGTPKNFFDITVK